MTQEKEPTQYEIELDLNQIRESVNWSQLCREFESVFYKVGISCRITAKTSFSNGKVYITIDITQEPKYKQ